VEHVALVADSKRGHEQDLDGVNNNIDQEDQENEDQEKEHRGFAFVTLSTTAKRNEAIEKGTIRAKVKETSKRKYTLYIRPIIRQEENVSTEDLDVCYLWKKFRCPYGNDCKFKHIGEGGCEEKKSSMEEGKRSKQKCFAYRTKGVCKLGEKCPFRHDFEPKKTSNIPPNKSEQEKDCINWKTKGKCRKGDKCPYRHDEGVREMLLAKKEKKADKKKRGREEKIPQPLSVRVFGLNYDTTEEDVRAYFEHCGTIKEITFPIFDDSGRSKGYCGILFVSPKATEKACELDGQELHGRWLSVQPGKMYLKQWEQREQERKNEHDAEKEVVGEFGQKVKKRKKHGYAE
jgi:RNA-binding proteins (RRM domain)